MIIKSNKIVICSYIIPNPSISCFLVLLAVIVIMGLAGYGIWGAAGCVVGLLLGACFFHWRNIHVRWEIEQGFHDPVWRAHTRKLYWNKTSENKILLHKLMPAIAIIILVAALVLRHAGIEIPFIGAPNTYAPVPGPVDMRR